MKRGSMQDFETLNRHYTTEVVARLSRAGRNSAVIAEAPPGAGKSTLTCSVAHALIAQDKKMRLAVVTQTNEQADDLVASLSGHGEPRLVARMVAGSGPSPAIVRLVGQGRIGLGNSPDDTDIQTARIVVATARKWHYTRGKLLGNPFGRFPLALIDEAYQMRSDALLAIADLFDTLFCVGDPGQLDPFTNVDDSLWKGLAYSPSRTAMGTLRAYHASLEPMVLSTSWRLPPSAAPIVSEAFYPNTGFAAGTVAGDRVLSVGKSKRKGHKGKIDLEAVTQQAAAKGWAYVELPRRYTMRTDDEIASTIGGLVVDLLGRDTTVVDERAKSGRRIEPHRIAVVAAHNDQVHAVRYALSALGQDPDDLVISTANKIQGREYDMVYVWHPLAGRRDATAFHLEAGRMCVMLSRHRQACVVVGREGSTRLLEEFPDSEPMFLDEPEKFPDGWEANYKVLKHLEKFTVS